MGAIVKGTDINVCSRSGARWRRGLGLNHRVRERWRASSVRGLAGTPGIWKPVQTLDELCLGAGQVRSRTEASLAGG